MSSPPPRGRSRTRSPDDHVSEKRLSESPVSRRRSYSPRSPRSRSRTPMRSRSRTPRRGRSYSPRAGGRSGSRTRSRTPRDRSPSRSPSRSRSRSRRRSRSKSGSRGAFKSSKIVIEKLTKNVTEEHIREIFGVYGDIKFIDMPLNPHFNTNRGLCYLLYHSPSAASAAIAHMHESQLDGSKIEVSIVIPRRIPGSAGIQNPVSATPSGPGGRYKGAGGGRYRSPPRRPGQGVGGGRSGIGGGFSGRGGDSYRPKSRSRSVSRLRSSYSRSRSPSRSRSRSPYRSRRGGGGRRRRSVSYSSYSSRSDSRSRSRSKVRKYSRSRSRSRDRRGGGGRDGRRR